MFLVILMKLLNKVSGQFQTMEVYVKKIGFFLLIAVLAVGAVSAQSRGDLQRISRTVTINGTLQLERGNIAVTSGSSVYLVPSLTRYIGFIEGLKEGATVSVEGYEYGNVLYPVKVTIAGKSYDFATDAGGSGGFGMMGPGFGMMGPGSVWDNSGRRNTSSRYSCCY